MLISLSNKLNSSQFCLKITYCVQKNPHEHSMYI